MRLTKQVRGAAVAALAATALAAWAPPALATGADGEAHDAAETATEAAKVAGGSELQGSAAHFDAEVRADPATGVSVDGQYVDFGIVLADAAHLEDMQTVSGQAVFTGEGTVPDYVVDASDDRLRVMSVMGGPSDAHSQDYLLDLPADSELTVNEHGGVSITITDEASGVTVSIPIFDAPWAVDAEGRTVVTRYEIEGHILRQVVEPSSSTAYPVTADPTTCSRFCYPFKVYFNKAETRTSSNPANVGVAIAGCAALGTLLGGPAGAAALGAACAAAGFAISTTAQNGVNSRPFRCLRIDFYWPSSVPFPRTYTGSRCN